MRNERGMALILMVVVMVQLALAMLILGADHQQHMHARLLQDERNAQRLDHIETIFNELALTVINNHTAYTGKGNVMAGQRQLDNQIYNYEVDASVCTHLSETSTHCWTIWVHAGGSGFERSRLLHVPQSSCSDPYWYRAEAG
ncbi:type II secretion system protein [Aliidiomarina sp. Khilg15.8]